MSTAIGGPIAAFADQDHTRTSPGPIGRPRVERYTWNVAFAVPPGVCTNLPFAETMLLPGPWAATEGAIAAAQTRIVKMNPTRRVQLPPARAMWKVAKRSKPSKRAMRAWTLQVPGCDIASVVRK